MKTMERLSEIVWNNRVDKFYLDQANIYRYSSLAAIFVFGKWLFGINADISLLWAYSLSTLIFGLFLNRIKHIAAACLFFLLAVVYYFMLGGILANITGLALLNPRMQPGLLAFLFWLLIASVLLGAAFLISEFWDRQMPREIHHPVLYCLLVLGHTIAYSWLIIVLSWYFPGLKPICFIVVIVAFIVALVIAKKPAQNISWDLFVARNSRVLRLYEDTDAIVEALPSALKSPRDVSQTLKLAMKYAQCEGIMRNAQQCIRWAEAVLDFLEGSSMEAHLLPQQDRDMGRSLAHMLLYVVYERSEVYKSPSMAEKHKNSFDHKMIDISTILYYWSDSNSTFEDHSDTRFFGYPYAKLQNIAINEPDAFFTLYRYCLSFAEENKSNKSVSSQFAELGMKYLDRGIELKSPACIRYWNMMQKVQQDFEKLTEGLKEEKKPSETPQYSLNPNYQNITISGK